MSMFEESYANPFQSLDQEWQDYGNGDPFILRYDGRYYLYVSTKDFRVGIKAWSSEDLINWTYEGLVTEDEISTGAYAPEVVYWNGYFYLYTSPAGQGHYVYRSEAPTGPFERMTENLGMTIDGSVFINDDASWYFTYAGTQGIVGALMDDPITFNSGVILGETFLGHWTEGSTIFKRDGIYYMTYAGNHVFSKGYRIHYATAKDGPLGPYVSPSHNPIIISTKPEFNGLGHNSIVIGPDLDSYYIVYHNLVGRSAEGPPVRQMNIDRLVFNGEKMNALGPTNYDQPVPKKADFYDRLDEVIDEQRWIENSDDRSGRIISKEQTEAVFTAEFNLRLRQQITEQTRLGVIFSYIDEDNYSSLIVIPGLNHLELTRHSSGAKEVLARATLPAEYDFTKLHTIRIEHNTDKLKVFMDHMLKLEWDSLELSAGHIGYMYVDADPIFSYTAFSNDALGSSDFEVLKPLPGTIEAVHYLKGENRGFHVKQAAKHAQFRQDDGVMIDLDADGSYVVRLENQGDWTRYGINVSESGLYGVDIITKAGAEEVAFELLIDEQRVGEYTIPPLDAVNDKEWIRYKAGEIELTAGYQTLMIKLKRGALEWKSMDYYRIERTTIQEPNVLHNIRSDQIHGQWQVTEAGYRSHPTADAKIYGGQDRWTNYRVELNVKLTDAQYGGDAGILFRVTNESDHPDQVSDALMGYYVSINSRQIKLTKHNYDETLLAAVSAQIENDKTYRLRVDVLDDEVTVFLDDHEVLQYKDHDAFMYGKVGIRMRHAEHVILSDLSVENLEQ